MTKNVVHDNHLTNRYLKENGKTVTVNECMGVKEDIAKIVNANLAKLF